MKNCKIVNAKKIFEMAEKTGTVDKLRPIPHYSTIYHRPLLEVANSWRLHLVVTFLCNFYQKRREMVVRMHGDADDDDKYFGKDEALVLAANLFWGAVLDSPRETTFALSDRGLMAAFGGGTVPFFCFPMLLQLLLCCIVTVVLLLCCILICCYCRALSSFKSSCHSG